MCATTRSGDPHDDPREAVVVTACLAADPIDRHFSFVEWVPSAVTVAPSGEVTFHMPQPLDRKDHSVNVPSDFGITIRISESEIRIRAPYGIRHSIGDVREKFNPRTSPFCSEDDSYGSDCVPIGVLMSSHVVCLVGSSLIANSMPLPISPLASKWWKPLGENIVFSFGISREGFSRNPAPAVVGKATIAYANTPPRR